MNPYRALAACVIALVGVTLAVKATVSEVQDALSGVGG